MFAVVATLTDAFTSNPVLAASTYDLLAASVSFTGVATFTILFELASISPLVAVKVKSPDVAVIVEPSTLTLSTTKDVNPATSVVVAPGFKDEEPSVIAFTATAPDVTVKSVESKDATPLLVSEAFYPATVIVVPVCVTSIPSPPNTENECEVGVIAP